METLKSVARYYAKLFLPFVLIFNFVIVALYPQPVRVFFYFITLFCLFNCFISQSLTHDAIRKRNSRDNVSVILIILNKWY
jgi:hypothetical protein